MQEVQWATLHWFPVHREEVSPTIKASQTNKINNPAALNKLFGTMKKSVENMVKSKIIKIKTNFQSSRNTKTNWSINQGKNRKRDSA